MMIKFDDRTKKSVAWGEVFLLVIFSFAIAFILGEALGTGVGTRVSAMPPESGVFPSASTVPTGQVGNSAITPYITKDVLLPGGEIVSKVPVYQVNGVDTINVAGKGVFQFKDGAWAANSDKALASKVPTMNPTNAASSGNAGSIKGLFSGDFFGVGSGGAVWGGALLSGAIWGGIVGGAAYGIAKLLGQTPEQASSIGLGLGAGTFVGSSLYLAGQNMIASQAGSYASITSTSQLPFYATPGFSLFAGIAVAATIIVLTYKKQKKELVRFECLPWEPPTGGSQCEKCNEDPLMPCSEYRCKSLGQACDIINPGTEEERCIWVGKGDTAGPHIEPWDEPLQEGLKYIPDTAISPPNRGFQIVDSEGDQCLKAFSDLTFGIVADEPAQCRISYEPVEDYDLMSPMGGNTLFIEEHSQRLKVPNPFAEDAQGNDTDFEIHNDGTYTLWVKCIDANGNGKDSALVAFRFCVDPSPDLEAPVIEGTSIRTGMPVQFGVDSTPIEVYLNEPAQCRWSRNDKAYEDMENVMSCGTASYQVNYNLDYTCTSELTGIEDRQENWFYFRCEDTSTAQGGHNVMKVSYPLMLQGTQELAIKEVGPSETISGSTSVVKVLLTAETMAGADEGKATCRISTDEDSGFFVMENTGDSYLHNQTLDLVGGNYTYYFECFDEGGNLDYAETNFFVDIDTGVPEITRAYKDGRSLKIVTDEDAKCYFSNSNCDFTLEDSVPMSYADPTKRNTHSTDWNEEVTYYVKCEDFQGNQPSPNECQMIVKASEL